MSRSLSLHNIFAFLDQNLLLMLSCFLIVFIPLWPKIPLFQPIPNYIVRIRIEDLLVGVTAIVWLIQFLQKKVSMITPVTPYMVFYIAVGFFSLLSALFVVKTIPVLPTHIEKAFLHLFRYIEYFSLFFFVFGSIRKRNHLNWILLAFLLTVIGATLYGIGQKYLRWPVYSTMNFEFSSGEPLELVNQQARVQSTFAGHYDFAIYMGLVLPLILVLIYVRKNKLEKSMLSIIFAMGLWSLIVSGLRSAFASYLLTVLVVTILLSMLQKTWWQRVKWSGVRLGAVYLFTMVMFIIFGNNLFALLSHAVTGLVFPHAQQSIDQTVINQYVLPVPRDQVENGTVVTGTKPEALSGCALQKEISLCIRLESLWPQAIRGFYRQPLLGSGYSSLNKRDFYHLSEADGTDNNYLRILGETGVLGFLSFLSIITVAVLFAKKKLSSKNEEAAYLAVIYFGIVIGILCNGVLIDVFAASKVAFTFWALTGMVFGYWKLNKE